MKGNAIARIVVYCILIALLTTILVGALVFRSLSFAPEHSSEQLTVSVPDGTRGITYPADQVSEIEIEWYAGSIRLEAADTDFISIEETVHGNTSQQTVYQRNGEKLTIQYAKKSAKISDTRSSKDLLIRVPEDWVGEDLTIDAGSAELDLCKAAISSVTINTASGNGEFDRCSIGHLEVNSASGSVHFTGTLEQFSMDAVSGEAELDLLNKPESIVMNTVSGDLTLRLPSDCGFQLDKSTLSGSSSIDFPTETKNDRQVYGNGACKIEFDGLSAKISIHDRGENAVHHSLHH